MKAITILQPWATLIVIGEKKFETRSWATKHRGELAIHAGKRIDREACEREPIKSTLAKHGYTADNLPTGVVVVAAQLTECWKVIGVTNVPYRDTHVLSVDNRMFGISPGNDELAFGDFAPGRFAWELRNVQQLPVPIPSKGQQGLWNWDEGGKAHE